MSTAAWPDLTTLQGVTPLTYEQANLLLNGLVIQRREAIDELDAAQTAEADAERDYRRRVYVAWTEVTGPAGERKAHVESLTADWRHIRDLATARVKTAHAHIARLKDEQIDVMWRGKWSQLIDATGGSGT